MLNNEADKNTTISYEEALHPRDRVNFDDMTITWTVFVRNFKTQQFLTVGDPRLDRFMKISLVNRIVRADQTSSSYYNDSSIGLHKCESEEF